MKILFVDDEPQILDLLQIIFDWESLGFDIVGTASNGNEALSIIKTTHIDILITDVNMPYMDGLELIQHSREIIPNLSVIIISAYDDFHYVKKALSLKVEDYLLKPIDEDEFFQIIDNLKEKHYKNTLYQDTKNNTHNYIRSNLLNRLVKDRISYLELEEKKQFINLNLDYQYYNIMMIKLKNQIQFGSIIQLLSEHFNTSKDDLEMFEDFDNNLVIILAANKKSKLVQFIDIKKDSVIPILQSNNIDYIISTGSIVDNIIDLPKSYINAQRLSGEVIFNYKEKNLNYEVMNKKEGISPNYNIDFKHLRKILLDSDYNGVATFLADIYKPFVLDNPLPFEANNLALRLIVWIDNFYDDLNIYLEESSQYYDYLVLGILQSNNTDELIEYILEHIEVYVNQTKIQTKKYSPIIAQIKKYVDNNYHKNISLKSLSSKYNVNPSYLGQLFNNEVGEYFNDYINRLKNERAVELLLTTDLTNYEIAMSLGYTEASYFYKKFKAYHGVAPNAFRKNKH